MSGNRHVFGWRWADHAAVWSVLRGLCRVGWHNVSCRGRRDHL